jgi:hypothetical protein
VLHPGVDEHREQVLDVLDSNLRASDLEVFTYQWHPRLNPEALISDEDRVVLVFGPPPKPEQIGAMTIWQDVALGVSSGRSDVVIATWAEGLQWIPDALRSRPMFALDDAKGIAELEAYLTRCSSIRTVAR